MRALVMYLGLLGILLTASSGISPDGYSVGDFAMDFSLKNVNGNMVSMSDYKDAKGFIVVFTCNT